MPTHTSPGIRGSAQSYSILLCHVWLVYLGGLFFFFFFVNGERIDLGEKGGRGGTVRSGGRGNCGHDVMYEERIQILK